MIRLSLFLRLLGGAHAASPNLIVILTDDQRFDALRAHGNPPPVTSAAALPSPSC